MLCKKTLVILLLMVLHVTSVHAKDAVTDAAPVFSFDGFGTFGVVHSSEKNADYISSIFKPKGAGYSHRWSADPDSVIAAQITADFTPQLKAVVQIVSEQIYDRSYGPTIEWANIKYQFTPDFSVRIGRGVSPIFLYSDTRRVGYTYVWIRPPAEVYRLLPVASADGIEFNYRQHWGDWINTLQIQPSRRNFDLANNGGKVTARHTFALSNTTEVGALTARFTYFKTYLTLPSTNVFFDIFRQFGPQGVTIADQYDFHSKRDDIVSVGASYDPGNWFVLTEWVHANSHAALGTGLGWYVSGGYRYGTFTPYVTYAKTKGGQLSDPGLNVAALPPFLVGPATGLNAALNGILSANPAATTMTIGARWDFSTHIAMKMQFDHTRNSAGSSGFLSNFQPGFKLGGRVNVFSATIDFVF